MKKMKYLRSWLTIALVVTIIGSLTGGTVAWFTDNVESTNNVIQSGTLDIDIELKDGQNWISLEKEPNTKVFDYALWEPGYTQIETMKIVNRGNLALEYILNVQTGTDEKKGPNGESLADAIEVYMCFGEPATTTGVETREAFHAAKTAGADVTTADGKGWWYAGTLTALMGRDTGFTQGYMLPSGKTEAADGSIIQTENGTLLQGNCTCTVALHMDEDAGNEYQNLSLGNIGFVLKAKQYMYEEDSFDEKYDDGADYGPGSIVNDMPYAKVRELEGEELNIICTDEWQGAMGLTFLDGAQTLDCGLVLTALDTPADLANKDCGDWSVDFEISSTKKFEESDTTPHIVLAGQYTSWCEEWLAFQIAGVEVEANTPQRVMEAFARMKYSEIVETVKEFQCGVILVDDYFVGESITLELCVYETDGHGNEIEGGRHVLKSFTFDF